MSFDPLSSLAEDVLSFVDLARQQKRRLPRVSVAWSFASGDYDLTIRVDGADVVHVNAASLEGAARKGREAFELWSNDQELSLVHALGVSLRGARSDRDAGVAR